MNRTRKTTKKTAKKRVIKQKEVQTDDEIVEAAPVKDEALIPSQIEIKISQTKEIMINKYPRDGEIAKVWRGTEIREIYDIPKGISSEELQTKIRTIYDNQASHVNAFFKRGEISSEEEESDEQPKKAKTKQIEARSLPAVEDEEEITEEDYEVEEDEFTDEDEDFLSDGESIFSDDDELIDEDDED